jgi:xanthine dehydrogenase molybdopterin-binding subunit B
MRAKPQNFLTLSELGCPHFLNMQTPTYHSTLDWGRIERIIDELEQTTTYQRKQYPIGLVNYQL